ncbi:Endonuclease/exonuclease/phosphatase [Plasmopara halstedii]|uniref:Endonuclease/exonuclease/phosphatase n=1 Tax=Plasmopara halstedii TaxID=4781 RepID=A0A0P1AEE8_PLAHL|nr:Endonuclease/exonuclease/phosphatase [Plasmopara halstedii]CEG39023.1 Endonuclease/exonuclease/phosphatase [Plasmopara halstedii]|eukprot:XP_024575392.1 Endonuclease/exonuclease/phosphatase [Plasmopara halstedii]
MDFSQLPPEHNLLLETVGGVDPTPVGEDERKDSCLEEIASAFEKNDQVRAAIRAILGKKDWRPAIKATQNAKGSPREHGAGGVGDHSSGPQEIQVPVEPLLTDFNHLIDDEGRQDRLFQDFQAQAKASRYLRKRTRKSRRGIRRKEMTFGLHTQNSKFWVYEPTQAKGICSWWSPSDGREAGVAIFVSPHAQISNIKPCWEAEWKSHWMAMTMDIRGESALLFSVYAPTNRNQREALVTALGERKLEHDGPVFIGGDFNCTVSPRTDRSYQNRRRMNISHQH